MNFLPGERGIASIRLPRQYAGIFLEVLVIVFYFSRISSQLAKVVGFNTGGIQLGIFSLDHQIVKYMYKTPTKFSRCTVYEPFQYSKSTGNIIFVVAEEESVMYFPMKTEISYTCHNGYTVASNKLLRLRDTNDVIRAIKYVIKEIKK